MGFMSYKPYDQSRSKIPTWFILQYTHISELTHWGRVTHICVVKLTTIGSDNGLSPDRCQAIIWTNAGILVIRPLGTNFSEISIEIYIFSFKKMHLKMSSAKWRPLCLCPNVLMQKRRFFKSAHIGSNLIDHQLGPSPVLKLYQ